MAVVDGISKSRPASMILPFLSRLPHWALAIAVVSVLTGCSGNDDSAEGAPSTALVERRDVSEEIRLSGDIAPAYQVDIISEVGGKIREINIVPGQKVEKGAVLFVIDDSDLQIERASAQVDINGAEVSVGKYAGNLARARELFQAKLISKEVYENLDADHRLSENALERAERRLEIVEDRIAKSRVVAPASGTILSIPVIAGEVVVAAARGRGTTLCTLADLSALLVEAHVNQLDIGKVTKGSIVEVLSGTDQANPTPAQLNFIAPLATIKNKVKGFAIEAVLEGETSKFRPGMTVGLRLPLATATNAVSVPVGSVFDSRSGKIVYLQQGDGDVEKRSVDVGATDLFYAEIREGLKEGDRILIAKPDDGNS